jgi:hypothetical protein
MSIIKVIARDVFPKYIAMDTCYINWRASCDACGERDTTYIYYVGHIEYETCLDCMDGVNTMVARMRSDAVELIFHIRHLPIIKDVQDMIILAVLQI